MARRIPQIQKCAECGGDNAWHGIPSRERAGKTLWYCSAHLGQRGVEYSAWREGVIASQKNAAAAEGVAFWAARGIKVGDAVSFQVGTLFGPGYAAGIARVSPSCGAYVASPKYPRRKISPHTAQATSREVV